MNRKLLALFMAAITLPVAAAQYVKPGAVLTLHPGQNNAEFNINASTGGWFGRMQYGGDSTANSCRRKSEASLGLE